MVGAFGERHSRMGGGVAGCFGGRRMPGRLAYGPRAPGGGTNGSCFGPLGTSGRCSGRWMKVGPYCLGGGGPDGGGGCIAGAMISCDMVAPTRGPDLFGAKTATMLLLLVFTVDAHIVGLVFYC